MKRRTFFVRVGQCLTLPILTTLPTAASPMTIPLAPAVPTAPTTGKRVGVWLVDGATPFELRITADLPRRVTWKFSRAEHITGWELQRDGFVIKGGPFSQGALHVLAGDSFTLSWNAEEEDRAFALAAKILERRPR